MGHHGGKKQKGQGTCIKDPWTRTMGAGFESGRGGGEQGRRKQ